MAVVLIIGGIMGGTLHYFHQQRRQAIRLFAPPGSIAVAATTTKDSPLEGLVNSGWDTGRIRNALHDHKFAVDSTGRIILADRQ
jgi:hypothetical protein